MKKNENLTGAATDLASWLPATKFTHAYIFGSLVHKSGAQFDDQLSDVDVICTFAKEQIYIDRWRALAAAEPTVLDLNLTFLKRFSRGDATKPITSLVAVTDFELAHGLHKDKSPQFFSHNAFYSVIDHTTSSIGAQHVACEPELEGVLDAIREAQRYRNKYLAVSANGSRSLVQYAGPDVLPKDFMRAAAQVKWAYDPLASADDRFDVNEGLVYAMQLLMARRHEAAEVNELLQRFVVRMGGRGQPSTLSPADQVLLWEVLAEEATGVFSLKGGPKSSPKRPARSRVSQSVRQEVFKAAGYRCCFPGCGIPLPPDGIGQLAFIVSPNSKGPRSDPNLSDEDKYFPKNFLLLCPTHHRVIDSKPDLYDAEQLRAWREASISRKSATLELLQTSKHLFSVIRYMLDVLA